MKGKMYVGRVKVREACLEQGQKEFNTSGGNCPSSLTLCTLNVIVQTYNSHWSQLIKRFNGIYTKNIYTLEIMKIRNHSMVKGISDVRHI